MQRTILCITIIIFTLSLSAQAQTFYNQDLEEGSAGPGKPLGWTASSQDYGDKTTSYSVDDTDPFEGNLCALMETTGTPGDPNDLSIASLTGDNFIALEKDHTYAVSAAVRRSHTQWTRFIFFSAGFSLIHTESIDALDDGVGDSGWQIMYLHFRAPSSLNAFVRIDSIVTNTRTNGGQTCSMWVDDIKIEDLGIEAYQSNYNVTPPPPQYGIRNRYFDLGTETEVYTFGGIGYSCTDIPRRWSMAMAVDTGINHAPGYPLWGQETPALTGATGDAGYIRAKAADTTKPAWPAIAADGIRANQPVNHGQRHVLTFDYGADGITKPLLRVFMINDDYSHYCSLFIDPSVGVPGNRMWPLSLQYTPDYYDEFIKVRFDNVTIGASGSGVHTDETIAYIDNVDVGVIDPALNIAVPGVPSGLSANAGNGLVSLRWPTNEELDLSGYNVYRSETSSGPYTKINGSLVLRSAECHYADDTVTNDTQYYYVITAVDGADNESGDSNVVTATPTVGMSYVSKGSFVMGDTFYDTDVPWMENSQPTRTVNLDAYWIGQYEVTNGEYTSVLNWANSQGILENNSGGAYTGGDVYAEGELILEESSSDCKIDYGGGSFTVESIAQETHPVVEVSWYGAVLYCNWLSAQDLKTPCYNTSTWECDFRADGYRLPTEAEWEKAAAHDPSKGTDQSKRRYPWGDTWDCAKCNNSTCGPGTTEEVGSYPDGKSYYDCYDMSGNVWEWCYDRWQEYYTGFPDPDNNPTGPATGTTRAVHGGSCYDSDNYYFRSAYRDDASPTGVHYNQGIRVARSDTPSSTMVFIPSGSYIMGDTIDSVSFSLPTRSVYLDEYWIGQYEVTNGEYASILNWANDQGFLENDSGGAYTGGDVYAEGEILLEVTDSDCKIDYNVSSFAVESISQETHPVVMVTWYGAAMYCNWLSQQEIKTPCYNTSTWECNFSVNGYRLPTEAEWERAAGHDPTKATYQSKRRYPWGDTWDCNKYNSWECGPLATEAVGGYPDGKSYYKCYDMAGNVWEWCYDWNAGYSGLPDPDSNPTGPASGTARILRGGGFVCSETLCRTMYRFSTTPAYPDGNSGFRVARTN